ncbi:MAG: alpha/beta hydrolase fold domain-containing protein [Solimonas sp.]
MSDLGGRMTFVFRRAAAWLPILGLFCAFIDFVLRREFPGLRDPSEADAYMDPRRAARLKGLPPTIVATAGFDVLRDCGRDFATRLAADGVPVADHRYGSLTHSFLQFSGIVADAERAATDTARQFGAVVRGGGLPATPFPEASHE